MKISEIFLSIEGEGSRTGLAAVFVRLFGCNLRCSYCDSMYAVEGNDYTEMTVEQVFAKVETFGTKCVTLTGGEPLSHPGINELLQTLAAAGYEVNIETNGTMLPAKRTPNMFLTMDWKCPSSGMNGKMDFAKLTALNACDVLKFVVGTNEDLLEAKKIIRSLADFNLSKKHAMPQVFFSPVFGTLAYTDIVDFILGDSVLRKYARFQVQLHKIVWDPDKRGV